MKPLEASELILQEFTRASKLYPQFHSNHEGYAVLKEEVDELWDAIKKSKDVKADEHIKHEIIQVGAMALRFLNDLC